ncbi:MAG: NAD+ synthase [Gammaproteobacteria bacterium]
MNTQLRIVLAQLNFLVGDIEGNATKIVKVIQQARDHGVDLIVFPELALTGYPPEDLLYRPELYQRIEQQLPSILEAAQAVDVILGCPERRETQCFNQAIYIRSGRIQKYYDKQCLPNYQVFDEARYFQPGVMPCIIDLQGFPAALTICEDLWFPEAMAQAKAAGAKLMISINASPFAIHKSVQRENIIAERAKEGQMPIVYVNCVGGQDELVFDGGSFYCNAQGEIVSQAPFFEEQLFSLTLNPANFDEVFPKQRPLLSEEQRVYQALVSGVRDYVEKNRFPRAVLGLSGGIDSALTLAIAVDAIGAERVTAVFMPSIYTASLSTTEAQAQAELLGIKYHVLPINTVFDCFLDTLNPIFAGLPPDVTEQNLQARCRGTLLMAISNKTQALVLATGNKSEMAVGYSTLYGDMVGGFCVLKDVLKTWVYRLADYRNRVSPAIPQAVIDRAPTAELAPGQLDQNELPPYSILDAIITQYIEEDRSLADIVQAGFDAKTVLKVIKMIDRSEYKRRQAAPGVRITERAFGKDRRYPITSGFLLNI